MQLEVVPPKNLDLTLIVPALFCARLRFDSISKSDFKTHDCGWLVPAHVPCPPTAQRPPILESCKGPAFATTIFPAPLNLPHTIMLRILRMHSKLSEGRRARSVHALGVRWAFSTYVGISSFSSCYFTPRNACYFTLITWLMYGGNYSLCLCPPKKFVAGKKPE